MQFGVIGGGAWGTALAQVLAAQGAPVRLWAYEAAVVDAINSQHVNSVYLPDRPLSPSIVATDDLSCMTECDALLVVTPAQHMRGVLAQMTPYAGTLILCCKGMEAGTQHLMTEVAAAVQPAAQLAVLSGPTFAHEVAAGLPTAVTFACDDAAHGEALARAIARPHFRPYLSDDLIGAEIGGAIKNIIAIGCGVVEGAALGQNARAALISRGYAEMLRFGLAKGARAETLAGLAGLGDLVLTCSSTASRNFSLGVALGKGAAASRFLADRNTVAEGAHSAPVVHAAAQALGVEMPIVAAINRLLSGNADVPAVIADLLARPLKVERH